MDYYDIPPEKKEEKKKSEFGGKIMKCIAIALVFGLIAGTAFEGSRYFFGEVVGTNKSEKTQISQTTPSINETTAGNTVTNTSGNASAGNTGSTVVTDVSDIVSSVMPSIVAITNMTSIQYQDWFGQIRNYEGEYAGSGIIVSQDDDYIYVATNNHVVSNAKSITVQFCDDTTVTAEVKGTDAGNDLAVVAVKISDIEADTISKIKVAAFGNSDSLLVGVPAIAIGNALGYGQSVTYGVISALDREVSITDDETGAVSTSELIQTDAAINPGNSGGALLNLNGEVIGINSVKYSDTAVEGMGYAIPINTASPIINKLISREKVDESQTAYLGISGVDVSSSVAQTYNMPEGVYVYKVVEGSAAAKAGLTQGDIITKFDGTKVASNNELEELMQYYSAGSEVEVTIQRRQTAENGDYVEQIIKVTLGGKN